MILGVHCSVRAGFDAALDEAGALDCRAMQMLPYRRHHDPSDSELAQFRAALEQSRIARLLVHSRFVPSLASSDTARRGRSVELLARELRLAAKLGARGFILHAGAYSPGENLQAGLELAVDSIIRACGDAEVSVPIVLENVPGGGRRIGGTIEELGRMIEGLDRRLPEAAICLDTAHAWAAGYDISSAEGMFKFLAKIHRLLGAGRVRAFHLNDTRALLGSHREHHGHWGEGYLGCEGLKVLLARPEYEATAGIIETPKTQDGDRKNLEYLKSYL